ncbi:hypothetical protein L1887_53673 [Cichorium endivia]|nr:hypothetical protein L1887_53673 [Cichorium endivia]
MLDGREVREDADHVGQRVGRGARGDEPHQRVLPALAPVVRTHHQRLPPGTQLARHLEQRRDRSRLATRARHTVGAGTVGRCVQLVHVRSGIAARVIVILVAVHTRGGRGGKVQRGFERRGGRDEAGAAIAHNEVDERAVDLVEEGAGRVGEAVLQRLLVVVERKRREQQRFPVRDEKVVAHDEQLKQLAGHGQRQTAATGQRALLAPLELAGDLDHELAFGDGVELEVVDGILEVLPAQALLLLCLFERRLLGGIRLALGGGAELLELFARIGARVVAVDEQVLFALGKLGVLERLVLLRDLVAGLERDGVLAREPVLDAPFCADVGGAHDAVAQVLAQDGLGKGEAVAAEFFGRGDVRAARGLVLVVDEVDVVDVVGRVVGLVGGVKLERQVGADGVDGCGRRRWGRARAGVRRVGVVAVGLLLYLRFGVVAVGWSGGCHRRWLDVGDERIVLVAVEVKVDGLSGEEAVLEAVVDEVDEFVDAAGDLELDGAEDGRLELFGEDLVERDGLLAFALECLEVGEVDATGEFALEDLLVVEGEAVGVGLEVREELAGLCEVEDVRVVGARSDGGRDELDDLTLDERHGG